MPTSVPSTLIVRPGALGDALLTLPVLQSLRATGTQRFLILGKPSNWAWIRPSPEVSISDWSGPEWLGLCSRDVEFPDSVCRKLAGVERALVYLRSGADQAMEALRRAGVREVLAAAPPSWPEDADDRGEEWHAAEQLLSPVRVWTGQVHAEALSLDQAQEPLLRVSDEERAAALRRLGLAGPPSGGFFAVHPGSGGRSKCWPSERYVELIQRAARETGLTPLVFLGPVEEETGLFSTTGLPPGTQRATSFPLREVLALLSMTRVFVGNDAGVTHLAARCCPTFQLFGVTQPSRWKALGPAVTAVEAPDGVLERLTVDAVWEMVSRATSGL